MRRSQTSLLLLIVGAVLVVGGIIYGSRSHYLGYKVSGPAKIAHTVADPNNDTSSSSNGMEGIFYLQLQGDPNIYYMNMADFVSVDNLENISPTTYSVSYDDTTSFPVNVTGKDTQSYSSYTISGTGYRLVQFTGHEGSKSSTLNTRQFNQNPQGRYEDDWPLGIGAIVLGALLLLAGLYFRRGAQLPGTPAYVVVQPGQMPPYPGQAPAYPGTPAQPQTPYPTGPYVSYPSYPPVQSVPPAHPSQPSYPAYPPVQPTFQAPPAQPVYPSYPPAQATPPAQPTYPPSQPAPSEQYGMGQYAPPSSSPQPPAQPQPISPEGATAYGGYTPASQPQLTSDDPDATQIGRPTHQDEE